MKKTKMNRFLLIPVLLCAMIFSCDTEDINSPEETKINSSSNEKALSSFVNDAPDGVFYSDYIASETDLPSRKTCTFNPDFNNLNLCGDNNYMPDISIITSWYISNNGAGYIDYELEQLFNYSCGFSYTCLRPNGPPIESTTGEVYFIESPSLNYDTFEYDVYNYLGDNISTMSANELKNHFACAIREYQEQNFPNSIIHSVDFYGDALLCSGNSYRYLKANFTMTRHGNPGTKG